MRYYVQIRGVGEGGGTVTWSRYGIEAKSLIEAVNKSVTESKITAIEHIDGRTQ